MPDTTFFTPLFSYLFNLHLGVTHGENLCTSLPLMVLLCLLMISPRVSSFMVPRRLAYLFAAAASQRVIGECWLAAWWERWEMKVCPAINLLVEIPTSQRVIHGCWLIQQAKNQNLLLTLKFTLCKDPLPWHLTITMQDTTSVFCTLHISLKPVLTCRPPF